MKMPALAMVCPLVALAATHNAARAQTWAAQETALANATQLTLPQAYLKAGESYFSHPANASTRDMIVFQATPVPAAGEASPFYAMYVASLRSENGVPTLGEAIRISPEGSANTCGWFHPTQPSILFGSTISPPTSDEKSGFRVGTRRYVWQFPKEMDIVSMSIYDALFAKQADTQSQPTLSTDAQALVSGTLPVPTRLFERDLYDAECSFDATGRFVLYTHVVPSDASEQEQPEPKIDGNIAVFDTKTGNHHALVTAKGYDGGPFFSADGEWICYRSDRKGDDKLQLFVAKLRFALDAEGVRVPVGIEQEFQITHNEHVNWAPFWHPSGELIVYGSSEAGHSNYELFAIEVPRQALLAGKDPATLRTRRITFAPGADILPAFNHDGSKLMWTSQRGGKLEGQDRPTSQLWIADWQGIDFDAPLPAPAPVKRETIPVRE
jgi:hypothetical protein